MAFAKANDIAKKFPDSLVIGADTVVDFDGQIIGKPTDAKDAERITRMLFSKQHKVITGVAFICVNKNIKIIEADTTIVYPKKLTDAQIAAHIKSGVWKGKAGAYSIRDNDPFVDHIDGSFTNVMGFPMEMVRQILSHY